jgi:DNA-binding MarR family transcriptional regulator
LEKNLDQTLVSVKISKLSKLIDRLLEQEIRPLGLRRGQHAILLAVADMTKPSFTELSQRLEVDKAAVTRSVSACEKHGWLRTDYARDSLKIRQVSLTKNGLSLVLEIQRAIMTVERKLQSELPSQLYAALKGESL